MEGQSSKALVWDARTSERKHEREKMFVQGWNSWKEQGVKGKDLACSGHSHQTVAYVPLTYPSYKHACFIYRHASKGLVLTSTQAIKPKLPQGALTCIPPHFCCLLILWLWLEVSETKERDKRKLSFSPHSSMVSGCSGRVLYLKLYRYDESFHWRSRTVYERYQLEAWDRKEIVGHWKTQ